MTLMTPNQWRWHCIGAALRMLLKGNFRAAWQHWRERNGIPIDIYN